MILLLTRLVICLSLALSGVSAASARIVMAVESVSLHDMVICGAAGAHVVTLDQSGKTVQRKSHADCRTCPDCQLGGAAAMPLATSPAEMPLGLAAQATRLAAILSLPAQPALLPPSHAPPKKV